MIRIHFPDRQGMSLAAISLSAPVAALVISCFSDINIGVLAIVFVWVVGATSAESFSRCCHLGLP